MTCASPCSDCDRKGLPILFTRYAAAYSAQDVGMQKLKELRPAGQFQRQPGGVALKTALYSVRMLRAGYLYVHVDRGDICAADEWKGYAVHPHGYLAEFDVMEPKGVIPHIACARDSRQANNSLVWIRNAQNVKKLWYLFHPDPISPEHLAKEIIPDPAKYMQSFDVAAWLNGSVFQPDTCQPGQLNSQVMEFAAMNSPAVQKVGAEQHYGLMGEDGSERQWGTYSEARHGKHFGPIRHEKYQESTGSIVVVDTGAVGGMANGPYIAEVKHQEYEKAHGPRLKDMADFLQTQKGAVVACLDPLGIVQELSLHKLTAAMSYTAWLQSTAIKDEIGDKEIEKAEVEAKRNPNVTNLWRETTGACLDTMVKAIHDGVMAIYDEKTDNLETQSKRINSTPRYIPETILQEQSDGRFKEISVKQIQQQRKDSLDKEVAQRELDRSEESIAQQKKALEKTQAHYDEVALHHFKDEHKKQQAKRDEKMNTIAEEAMAWFEYITSKSKVLEIYSRTPAGLEFGDGANCAAQLCAALTPMSSSPRGRQWFASLNAFVEDPKNLIWRIASFNNDEISRELLNAMKILEHTLPPAPDEDQELSVKENARQQRALADMITALSKISTTLKQADSIVQSAKQVLGKNTPLSQRWKALQKIVETAKSNIYALLATVVTLGAQKMDASDAEKYLAKGQLILLSHGTSSKARQILEKDALARLEALKATGKKVTHNPKKNPEPGSRAWKRKFDYAEEKMRKRIERLAQTQADPAARSMRIPAAIGMVEFWSLQVSLRRGYERGDDPRAGMEAVAAIFHGAGALKSGLASFYESSMYSELSARLRTFSRSNMLKSLETASSLDLQAMKAGAAHWVAGGSIFLAMKDGVDAAQAFEDSESALAWAYLVRGVISVAGAWSALLSISSTRNNIKLFRFFIKISDFYKGGWVASFFASAGLTYLIGKIKEDDWIRWLEAQPFRKQKSTRIGFKNEDSMRDALANVIADMDIVEVAE